MPSKLAVMLAEGALLTLAVCAVIQNCHRNIDSRRPSIVYYVNGKPIITRTFKTNQEMRDYSESEQGRREAQYYTSLNNTNSMYNKAWRDFVFKE